VSGRCRSAGNVPGAILLRRWPRDYGALPGDGHPPLALIAFLRRLREIQRSWAVAMRLVLAAPAARQGIAQEVPKRSLFSADAGVHDIPWLLNFEQRSKNLRAGFSGSSLSAPFHQVTFNNATQ
jgi:hypothetical protein